MGRPANESRRAPDSARAIERVAGAQHRELAGGDAGARLGRAAPRPRKRRRRRCGPAGSGDGARSRACRASRPASAAPSRCRRRGRSCRPRSPATRRTMRVVDLRPRGCARARCPGSAGAIIFCAAGRLTQSWKPHMSGLPRIVHGHLRVDDAVAGRHPLRAAGAEVRRGCRGCRGARPRRASMYVTVSKPRCGWLGKPSS